MALILSDETFQFCIDQKKEYDDILSKLFPAQSEDAARVAVSIQSAKDAIIAYETELKNELNRLASKWLIERD